MREAFEQARRENPDSPLAPIIKDVDQAQTAEKIDQIRKQKEKKQLAEVKKQFYNLGEMWFDTQADIFPGNRIPIEQRRKEWLQGLTTLRDKPSEQRIELLNTMASGMQLTGDHAPPVYARSFFTISFDNPFDFLRDALSGVNFTPQSILFMNAISDMSGHSEGEKQEFKDFMTKKSELKGKIGLPQLFPGISRWLDHVK